MKKILSFASALCLLLNVPMSAGAWIEFLDGSTLPVSPWQFYQDGGADGDTLVVDFYDPQLGDTNQALRVNSGANSTEWYTGPLFADEAVGAARFKTVAFSGTDSENLLCVEVGGAADHSAAPSITIVTNRYKLWSYTEGTFGSGIGGSQIMDLGPVVVDQFHTAYIYAHKSGLTRLWWDGHLVFDGIAPAVIGADGYMEWGSGAWQYHATTTVDFDWVGFGDASDQPDRLDITQQVTEVVISWSTNNPVLVLQSTASLPSSNWIKVPNAVSVVGTRSTVTNAISGFTKYYRLTRPPSYAVNFNDLLDGALNGDYAGLDWGSGVWGVGGPWAGITSQSAYQGAGGGTETGRISGGAGGAFLLRSLRATADSAWTISLIDNNGQTAIAVLGASTPATLTTGWINSSVWVDVTSSVGFNAVIDDLRYFR